MDSRFGGGGVFLKPLQLCRFTLRRRITSLCECLAELAGARDRNHLRGREPWGIEEKEVSEYVSSAKPISK